MNRFAAVALVVLGACSACEQGPHERQLPRHEPELRPRRVIEPPVGIVRPLPPHLISPAGVGPYKLGDRLSDLLQQLPSGPRIAVFEVPNILHRSLIRAEEGDSVRIGGEPNGAASFIAVVAEKVARTEAGIHVGSTRAELLAAGPLVDEPGRAHDPRIVQPQSPRGMHALFATDDTISAIVVMPERSDPPARVSERECPRPAAQAPAFGTCLGAAAGEVVSVSGNDIAVRAADTGKALAVLRMPDTLVFAAPLRVDGRDELVVITRKDETSQRTWSLTAYQGPKFTKTADQVLYAMSAANARWIGADLGDIDLVLELVAGIDSIEVGGLLTTRNNEDIVVISPVTVARKRGKPAVSDAGSASGSGSAAPHVDAGADPADASEAVVDDP